MTNQPGILPDDLDVLVLGTEGANANSNKNNNPPTNQSPTKTGQENNQSVNNDNKNNALDTKSGEAKTAEQLAAEEAAKSANANKEQEKSENEEEIPLVLQLAQKFNYAYSDEELAALKDSDEDLEVLVDRIAEQRASKRYEDRLNEKAELKDLIAYVEAGGNVADFTASITRSDYFQNLKYDEVDTRLQKEAVAEFYRLSSNLSEDDINAEIKDMEDSGTLAVKAKRYLEKVQGHYKEEKTNLVQRQKAEQARIQQEAQEAYAETVKIINSADTVKKLPIAASEKQELIKFITPDPKTGVSDYDKAVANFTTEDYIALALLVRKGFDLSGLVEKTVETKKAESTLERYKRLRPTNGQAKSHGGGNAVDETISQGIKMQ